MIKQNGDVDWFPIQSIFDEIKNVDELFYYLRQLVNDLQICTSNKCEIYHELSELDRSREKFEEFKSPEQAKNGFENKIMLQKWMREYLDYRNEAKTTFARIYGLKTTKDASEAKEFADHQRFMEIVKEFTKGNKPMPADFQKAVQNQIDRYGKVLTPDDPKVQTVAEQMQAQIKNTRKDVREGKQ